LVREQVTINEFDEAAFEDGKMNTGKYVRKMAWRLPMYVTCTKEPVTMS